MTRLVEDRALLDGFRRGERAALAEVYREYARALFALLGRGFTYSAGGGARRFKGFGEPWALEEAVQEVFARAFSGPARCAYDGLRPYRNYLFSIARNYVLDLLRAGGLHPASSEGLLELGSEAAPAPLPPEEIALREELARHCRAFVSGLGRGERDLFEARFVGGLSIQETARRLKLTEHRVKAGERALRKRFFLHLRDLGYFDGLRLGRAGIHRAALLLLALRGGLR